MAIAYSTRCFPSLTSCVIVYGMATRLTPRQRLDRQISERELMENYMDAARTLGWKVMHVSDSRRMVNSGGRLIMVGDNECKGWPDLFLCHPRTGRLLAVEVKKEVGSPVTDEQQEWLDVLGICGVETFVLRPSSWEDGASLLRRRMTRAA